MSERRKWGNLEGGGFGQAGPHDLWARQTRAFCYSHSRVVAALITYSTSSARVKPLLSYWVDSFSVVVVLKTLT